ncbi:helix-turn-helix domain-containing protein [Micromonospora sp. NPDC048170]|uniref:TetR/AcrR family transcriptional regulator n=1 Tax=Micromonospora sp. NPDC048170 TaxID=3154819 RepID=UPI0033CC2FF4
MSPRRAAALRGGDQSLRDHLIAAARRLIAARGTGGLTVRDIAREAGVADGVLYNHFADKEELLAYALHAHVGSAAAGGGPLPEAGTATVEANLRTHLTRALALHAAILPALTGLLHQPRVLARFAELAPSTADGSSVRSTLVDYLRAEQQLGRVAPDARVDAVAALVVGVCHDLVLSRLLDPAGQLPPEFSEQAVDDLADTLLRGIAPTAG